MAYKDTIRLGFGHSLVLGNVPAIITPEMISRKNTEEQRETESYGLFDSAQPNYTTYYPDLNVEDLNPKDNEFVYPVFRSLSEVIVHKKYNPVDFSMNGILKKSMGLLVGQTINIDHETATGNAMGAVLSTSWENAYTTKNGIKVPAGINSKFKIDGKSNPRIARGILMDPPSIHSASVTVEFLWEKSHASLSEQEFFAKLGTYDKDKNLIRRIANKVQRYHEISLVPHGADPYAQRIKDGEINNPQFADIAYNTANPGKQAQTKYFYFDFKADLIQNEEEITIPENHIDNNPVQKNNLQMREALITLAALFGVTLELAVGAEPTAEQLTAMRTDIAKKVTDSETALSTLQESVNATKAEVTRLKGIEQTYNEAKVALDNATELQAFQQSQLTLLRAETTKNYNLLNPTQDEAFVTLIAGADYNTLTLLNKQYAASVEAKFPLTCKSCNSTEVNRASAKSGEGKGGDNKAENKDAAASIAARKRQEQSKMNYSS